MLFTWRFSLLLIIFLALQVVLGIRFKIALPRDEVEAAQHRLFRRSTACQDKQGKSTNNVKFPIDVDKLPWGDNNPRTKLYTSAKAASGIKLMYSWKVPGLDGETIQDVIHHLQEQNCLSFPYGGCVRDQFLGATPADLDMETNCDADTFYNICLKKWGKKNCPRYPPNSAIVHVGNPEILVRETDIIDASSWDITFFGDGTALEYTTNSISYFAGNLDIIIDLTGTGVDDTCGKVINIPVGKSKWDKWMSYSKVFRFWKLRVKGYSADSKTIKYIVEKAEAMLDNKPALFQSLYCHYALLGEWNRTTKKCKIEQLTCENNKKKQYNTVFEQDLGDVWTNKGFALVKFLDCYSCRKVIKCKLE